MSDTPTRTPESAAQQPSPGPGVVSTGWLAANSTFEHKDERHLGPAAISSVVFHGLLFVAVVTLMNYQPQREVLPPVPEPILDLVYIEQTGPGGGGGGSPEPAPPKPVEIPETTPPEPVPVIEPEPEVTPPPPIPVLNAPVMTNNANVIQASGTSAVSLASYGGGGRGGGIGSGSGDGVGPGEGGGTGGGANRPGNGIEWPRPLHQERPNYTSEGMRAKIQGVVKIDAVIAESGRVVEVAVAANGSLDRQHGLDEAALAAARKWVFAPCTRGGEPVTCKVTIELEFRIH